MITPIKQTTKTLISVFPFIGHYSGTLENDINGFLDDKLSENIVSISVERIYTSKGNNMSIVFIVYKQPIKE